jgi:hypothetical protein
MDNEKILKAVSNFLSSHGSNTIPKAKDFLFQMQNNYLHISQQEQHFSVPDASDQFSALWRLLNELEA